MKKIATSIMTLAAVGLTAGWLHAATVLDDTVWNAKFDDADKTEDTLVFVDGKFISTKCVPYGYKTSGYTASKAADATKWSADQKSGADKMSWAGESKGDSMSGQFVRTTPNGTKSTVKWTATKAQ